MLNEIDAADHRQPFEALAHARDVEPRSEKAGTLGALTGRDDYQHALSLPWMATKNSRLTDQSPPRGFGGILQRLVHGGCSPQHQGQAQGERPARVGCREPGDVGDAA